jgi:hypothetical protein
VANIKIINLILFDLFIGFNDVLFLIIITNGQFIGEAEEKGRIITEKDVGKVKAHRSRHYLPLRQGFDQGF